MTSRGKAGEIGFGGGFFEAWGFVIVFLCTLFSNALHIRGVPQFGTPGLVAHVKHTTLSHTGSQGPGML